MISEEQNERSLNDTDSSRTPGKELIEAVNVRSMSLIILSSIATIYFINWAQSVLLPLVVAVLISYALDPLVSMLDRLRMPRPLSAAIVLITLLGAIAATSIPLQRETMAMLDKIPVAINKFQRNEAANPDKEEGLVEKAQAAAKKIEESAAQEKKATQPAHQGVTPVRVVDNPMDIQQYVLKRSPAALVLISQCFSVLLLVYFILAIGSLYKRKIVKISGPSFGRMRKAASGIPYLGPFLVLVATGVAAFIQFGEADMAIIVAGTSLGITSIQGYLLTPWLTSQVSSLNAVVIFIGLLFWGWLWGPVGLIIATPVLMIIKSLCDHVVNLRPVGELLGK